MIKALASLVALLALSPLAAGAQDSRAALEGVARAMGADTLKSLQVTGSGTNFAVGQNARPEMPWPRFIVKSLVRTVNYETGSLRDEIVRLQGETPPRGGGQQPVRGEQRQVFVMSGQHAWNVVGDAAIPSPITVLERQFQLWATPHGVVKAALANSAQVQGRSIAFAVPGRLRLTATLDASRMVERVEGVIPHPVLGDLPIEVTYAEYRDFGGVKFPTRIRQTAGGYPSLDLTVADVRPNAAADLPVPDSVRQAGSPYSVVTNQMVADGVWYVTGGTHHSVAIEMADHVIVVEAPLNDERALAVIGEVRSLVDGKPIRYVVNSHHHFDHAGGLRAVASEGITVLTHDVNRAFLARALGARATIAADHLARSTKTPAVEGVSGRRVLTDGTRVVEIHHIAGNPHHDGLLMVYLPKEKLLVQADAFTPGPANTPPALPLNQSTVSLADNLKRLGLAVDTILPLHGRIVPLAELHKASGHSH